MPSENPDESARQSSNEREYTALWLQPHGALRTEVLRIYEGDRGIPLPENSHWECSDSKNDAICMHLKEPRADGAVFSGNWQADIITEGGKSTAVGVLVETSSLFTVLINLNDNSVQTAIAEFAKILNLIDVQKSLSISSNKSTEEMKNLSSSLKSAISIYFLTQSSRARSEFMKMSVHTFWRKISRKLISLIFAR